MNVCFEGCLLWLYCSIFKCMTDRCSFQPSNGENWSLPQFIFWVRAGTRGTGPGDNGSDWSRPITWPGYWPRIGRISGPGPVSHNGPLSLRLLTLFWNIFIPAERPWEAKCKGGPGRIRRREKFALAQNWSFRFKLIRAKYWGCIIQK